MHDSASTLSSPTLTRGGTGVSQNAGASARTRHPQPPPGVGTTLPEVSLIGAQTLSGATKAAHSGRATTERAPACPTSAGRWDTSVLRCIRVQTGPNKACHLLWTLSIPVVFDTNVQSSKHPSSKGEDLRAVDHDVSQVLPALDFIENRSMKSGPR